MYSKGRDRKRGLKGSDHGRSKIDEDIVKAIRSSAEADGKVAARYGIARTTVNEIRRRRSWAHIE
jgi:hypothetical protein